MALYPGKLGEESHTGDNRIMPMLNRLRLARAKFRRNKLQKKIHSAMEESRSYDASCPAQRFFPKDKLCQVINTTTVFDELVKCLPNTIAKNQIQEYADRICDVTVSFEGGKERRKSYRLIFVILVLVERSKHILSFLRADVSDLDLPLEPVKERGIVSGMRRHRSISEGTPHEFLECFKDEGWSPSSMEQFDRYQWFMLAPFFSHGEYGQIKHYIFHDQHILPFITQNEVGVDETEILGGFGRVIMVTMHHAHHDFNSETNLSCNFAVKQVFENDRQSFQREREIWKKFSGGNSHRHIVSLLATYSHRNKYHFIFDRAQGDLMQFWERYEESPILTHSDVVWVADQCYGITEGLSRIHKHKMFKSDISTPDRYDVKYGRHGDINPQNILWFRDDTGESDAMEGTMRGTLKITDFGTAEMRSFWTSPREQDDYNGFTYRAPESDSTDGAIQQARDIWALGCVLLDFVTWTLGGASLVQRFAEERLSRDPAYGNIKTDTFFELVFKGDDLGMEAKIKDSIFEFVKALHNHPRCTEFLHNLLNIVICDMLLLKSEERLNCWQICTKLRRLRDDCQSNEYAMGYSPWRNIDQLSPEQVLRPSARGLSRQTDIIANWLLPPLESWEFHVDNDFAGKALENISMRTSLEIEATRNILCKRCAKLNFWSSRFAIVDQLQALAKSALNCDLCKLLHDASYGNDSSSNGQLRFERIDSVIMMTGHTFPLLSLMRNPELVTPIDIQVGKPWLADLKDGGLNDFFSLAQNWLKDCDKSHEDCRARENHRIPTRLIDVGNLQTPVLRLVETKHESILSPHYIALSHPWGNTDAYEPFVTLRKDDSGAGRDLPRFTKSIPYDELPNTFKHAVYCTRNLNIRYLWIDSICIIQGMDGDFAHEAQTMEDVYSGAYCVVAASRASDQRDGFLGARPRRNFVTFQPENPFYVCQVIDRFNEDVIEGPLNQRGWVLQERALARRTIYFTKNQTYFECGEGVRCETLTKMQNNMVDFLGDPNFPNKAMRVSLPALKITYFQGLYRQYSRMGFTRWSDRPIAIAGLEKRLQKAYNTTGRYGIFDDGNKTDGSLFHRSLLWRRAWGPDEETDGAPLEAIAFSDDSYVPSWSWMAYKGGIDYTDPPYRSATWEIRELIPPWTRGGYTDPENNEPIAIAAVARDFNLKGRDPEEVKIAYDTEQGSEKKKVQCVIVARSNVARSDLERRYYVLLVIAMQEELEDERWVRCKRVGAGFMLGKYIAFDKMATEIRIY